LSTPNSTPYLQCFLKISFVGVDEVYHESYSDVITIEKKGEVINVTPIGEPITLQNSGDINNFVVDVSSIDDRGANAPTIS
jgi:hypothetical protein